MSDTPETVTIVIPSSEADRKRLRGMIEEMVVCHALIDAQRDTRKTICATAHEEFGIPKKMINKMARIMHKHNYASERAEQDDFDALYETITGQK
jgi:Transcriptional regulator DsbA